MTRLALPSRIAATGVIAVLRAQHARSYLPVVAALRDGGVTSIELTLSTSGVIDELPALIAEFGDEVEFGVGTVTSLQDCDSAIAAGAAYLVTPVADTAIVARSIADGVPCIMGGMSPTELHAGWAAGASAVKLFPASTVGPTYLGHLHGPFPDMKVIPSGGIGLGELADWLEAGAVAVSIGSPLIADGFGNGSLPALTARARRAVDAVREARSAH